MNRILAAVWITSFAIGALPSRYVAAENSAATPADSVWVTSIAKSGQDGSLVASTASGLLLRPADVVSFEAADPTNLTKLYSHPAAVWRIVANDDGGTIASVDYRGNLVVYQTASEQAKTFEKAFQRWCQSLVMTPDDKFLIAGNEAGKVLVWNLESAKIEKSIELDGHAVTGLAISPDASKLAAVDGGGNVHLLDWPKLESTAKIGLSEDPAWCVAFTENGSKLLIGSGDRNLYRCDAVADAKPEVVMQGSDWITTIAISPDGQVVAGEIGGKLHFLGGGNDAMTAPSGVWAIAWNGDGKLLAGTRKHGVVTAGRSWSWTQPADQKETSESAESSNE